MPLYVNEDSSAPPKLCITITVSQRIKQRNMFGPLLVRTVPPRPTEQGQKLLALLRQVELRWKKSGWAMNKPALRRCCCRWRLTPTVWRLWLLPALAPVLAVPIRLNLQVEDETHARTSASRRQGENGRGIWHQALPSCTVDKLGALDYLSRQSRLPALFFPMALPGRRC